MPAKRLVIPKFPTERAEAEWFDKNRGRVEADMARRLKAGDTITLADALKASAAREKAARKSLTLRMRPQDLNTARHLAAEKGLPYQTYVKLLLQEALEHELAKRNRVRPSPGFGRATRVR